MNDDRAGEYDPFEYVPERTSPLTATGLAWLYERLGPANKARLRSRPIERQADFLAHLIERGAIGPHPKLVAAVRDRLKPDSESERDDGEASR